MYTSLADVRSEVAGTCWKPRKWGLLGPRGHPRDREALAFNSPSSMCSGSRKPMGFLELEGLSLDRHWGAWPRSILNQGRNFGLNSIGCWEGFVQGSDTW